NSILDFIPPSLTSSPLLGGFGAFGAARYFAEKIGGEKIEYSINKEQADKVLGYKRVRGSSQLEFLFDGD
ncbi:MAG: hypothetical protein KC506_00690, partial [Nanoarchaeota archaeon]|nr:hypothetical protein [Nanoarchaeota archaeon]